MRMSDWSSDVCSSDLDADLGFGAAWNWPPDALPGHAGDAALATFLGAGLGAGGRIVELDRVRDGRSETGELASVPMWMLDCTQAWVLVPLVHFKTLAGVILLARPPVDRALAGGDFALLRVAGRARARVGEGQRGSGRVNLGVRRT